MTDRPIEEIQAGDAFRMSLVPRCDMIRVGAPLWHGWALMDAFLAGIDYARKEKDSCESQPQAKPTQS